MTVTHLIPSMQLALSNVKLKDGLIIKGEVVNGSWLLVRNGDNWEVKNNSGGKALSTNLVEEEDNQFIEVPKAYGETYEDAFHWLEIYRENQLEIAAALGGARNAKHSESSI